MLTNAFYYVGIKFIHRSYRTTAISNFQRHKIKTQQFKDKIIKFYFQQINERITISELE